MRKKKILIVTEFSLLNTGYSVYSRNLLSELVKREDYEINEFSLYLHPNDPLQYNLPWKCYANLPLEHEVQEYESDILNQFGKWRFEKVCLYARPDVILSTKDHWMDSFILHSPLKKCFKFLWMPACDGKPQNSAWIADFIGADKILAYNSWSLSVLKEQGGDLINTFKAAHPGTDPAFYPVQNKKEHKKFFGFDPDCFIVGTNMRNQKRKLFPDLFFAFRKFLNDNEELGRKTYLYCHTSFPDSGWNLPRLLKENSLQNKVLFSYVCHSCGKAFPSFFADSVTTCRFCGQNTARFPNTKVGLDNNSLAQIYNLFDVYVQYANAEGSGFPQIEAASCAVPVMSVDYSAMEDIVRKLKGIPIKVQQLARESETHVNRAIPNNDDFVARLAEFLSLPSSLKLKKGFDARKGVLDNYTWRKCADVWEEAIDSVGYGNWNLPANFHTPNLNIPQIPSNSDFVDWCIVNILGMPEKIGSYWAMSLLRDLNHNCSNNYGEFGITDDSILGARNKLAPFNRNDLVNKFVQLNDFRNYWENERVKCL